MTTETRANTDVKTNDILLDVQGLTKHFSVFRLGGLGGRVGDVRAVDDVSFSIREGETYGLVGESGSGKTTVGKLILRLEQPTRGKVWLAGLDVASPNRRERQQLTGAIQAVFQDPYSSLSPRMRVRDVIAEPLTVKKGFSKADIRQQVSDALVQVGLPRAALTRFPHEFSGGQRQRIAIARAVTSRPRLIVLDEPVSALDVSIRAQILNLLKEVQRVLGLSYLFIAHDLAIVEHMADRIGVMYLGQIVEEAPGREIFRRPLHPYTQALLAAVPVPDPTRRRKEFTAAVGEIPSAMRVPSGCRFHPRCPFATDLCSEQVPEDRELTPGHRVACHHVEMFLPMTDEESEFTPAN